MISCISMKLGLILGLLGVCPQEAARPAGQAANPDTPLPRSMEWKEGAVLRIRIPVAGPERELMTTVAFPEEKIETAITGWAEGTITATAKKNLLFLRLPKKGEGHLNVIGGSGTHYLLYLEGVEKGDAAGGYDTYVKIRQERTPESKPASPRSTARQPHLAGSLELIQAMRLGAKPEGATIVRARGEVAYRSGLVEIRLLYVYKVSPYIGRVYEVENLTNGSIPFDAASFHAKDPEKLIVSGLRENVIPARSTTRLYTVFQKE